MNQEYYQDPRLITAIDKWDVLAFLSNHNVSYQMEGKNIGTNFVGVDCPGCGDARSHAGIHIENKYLSCFLCKTYMGPLKIISHYAHMSIKDAFYYLINSCEEDMDVEQRVKMIFKGIPESNKENKAKGKDALPKGIKIDLDLLKNNQHLNNIFKEKHLHLWHVDRYNLYLGTEHPFKDNLIWPVYERQRQVSFQARNIKFKRYHAPTNVSSYLYGFDWVMPDKPLVLVEGFFDYTRIDSYIRCRYPNDVSITTGLLKSLSSEQIKLLTHLKIPKMVVMFDRDSWFDYNRIKHLMPFDVQFVILPNRCDPNMLTWNQIDSIFRKEIL